MIKKIFFCFFCMLIVSSCTKNIPEPVLSPGQICVGRGDTVYSIADQHHVSVRTLVSQNRLIPPYILKPGQILVLPESSLEATTDLSMQGPQLLPAEDNLPPLGTFQKVPPLPPVQDSYIPLPPPTTEIATATKELLDDVRCDALNHKKSVPPVCVPKKEKNLPPLCGQDAFLSKPAAARSAPVKSAASSFLLPVSGSVYRSFGEKGEDGKKCQGVRLSVSSHDWACASSEGKVLFSGNELGGQNIVVLQHTDGFLTAYGPLKKISVKKGQAIVQGDRLGPISGKTLYFEMRKDRLPVDPMKYISR